MVLLIHEEKLAFVHVPRSAGTSVAAGLVRATTGEVLTESQVYDRHEGGRGRVHVFGPEVRSLIPDGYFSFAIARDPVDRIVSMWRHARSKATLARFAQSREARSHGDPFLASNWELLTDCVGAGAVVVDRILRFEHLERDFEDMMKKRGSNPERTLPFLHFSNGSSDEPDAANAAALLWPSDFYQPASLWPKHGFERSECPNP